MKQEEKTKKNMNSLKSPVITAGWLICNGKKSALFLSVHMCCRGTLNTTMQALISQDFQYNYSNCYSILTSICITSVVQLKK